MRRDELNEMRLGSRALGLTMEFGVAGEGRLKCDMASKDLSADDFCFDGRVEGAV